MIFFNEFGAIIFNTRTSSIALQYILQTDHLYMYLNPPPLRPKPDPGVVGPHAPARLGVPIWHHLLPTIYIHLYSLF